jgi:hypothetical protein
MSNHGIASTSAAPAQSAAIMPMKSLGVLDVGRLPSRMEKFTAGNFWAATSEADMFEVEMSEVEMSEVEMSVADTSCAAAFCSMDAVSPLASRLRGVVSPCESPRAESSRTTTAAA